MKLIMATEAQRLIGISLAKIAQSRCVRGGVSLHKNLLVATVLQKARYLFMEEAFHMVHGHYINQQNSKLIEQQQQLLLQHHHQKLQQLQQQQQELLQQQELELENQKCEDDSELESIFNPLNSLSSSVTIRRITEGEEIIQEQDDEDDELEFFRQAERSSIIQEVNSNSNKENNPPSNSNTGGVKRRLDDTDWNNEDTILSIVPKSKQIKTCDSEENCSNSTCCDEPDSILSSSELPANSNNDSLEILMSNNKTSTPTSATTVTPLDNSTNSSAPSSSIENIDRITSLVSIFNFGSLQRSVSTPDLCSSQATKNTKDTVIDNNNCCNLNTQRQYLAMTV